MGNKAAKPDPVEVIAAALGTFGELTAANLAKKVGIAYSTVTPKLRALEDAKRAERVKKNGQTLWRLVTATAHAPARAADPDTDHNGAGTGLPDTGADPADTPPPAAADGAADEPQPDGATQVAATTSDGADAAQPATENAAPATTANGKTRRPKGALDRTAMRIAQAHPDREFKVLELARLIDQTDAADGHNYPTASPGAVVLCCDRLADRGHLTKVNENPNSYKFAKALPAKP